MSEHTPGPWRHDKARSMGGAPVVTGDTCWLGNVRVVAKVIYHNGSEDPEVEANAALIAAAPDLLEALEKIVEYIEDKKHIYFTNTECGNALGHVRSVAKVSIAKAKGKGQHHVST